MTKRIVKSEAVKKSAKNLLQALENAVAKQSKQVLQSALLELARSDVKIRRRLELQFGVEASPEDLVKATQQAIAAATDFDERDMNTNFDIDYDAYKTVQINFKRLAELGRIDELMELACKLSKSGSYQVMMSDEGLMTDQIESCLKVVTAAVARSKKSSPDVVKWCDQMIQADRDGLLDWTELEKLRQKHAADTR